MRNEIRELLVGYLDGELSDEERTAVEAALAEDPDLRAELEEFRKLKEVTGMAQYADLPPQVWEQYWESLYRKLERGAGWIFLSLGAIVLLGFGLYEAFRGMYYDPLIPLWVKVGVSVGAAGVVILLVSYGRERYFAFTRDRYRRVLR
ncbi:MAG TPA: zf-HC2 domain-containing protein [candidate division Zixibacteria bacterium]|nr:zf-HC2 domain-containing protein [candidate division Zixibacteria bacterium]MDD4918962.1 zf-HC2 domain-containing protein [candidate division Zixibacteria bacterium]MDM7973839.1 zf-HC2 domain-containing protein [candidate division Zixibacteria bacterium]HOD66389.1 zf-HC2 domain-containing protein [candidate division Zixibacteria bacterium]HPM36041.1 zf-HC2 domain-containing protein [candidate division Zixibacteria bacterium]